MKKAPLPSLYKIRRLSMHHAMRKINFRWIGAILLAAWLTACATPVVSRTATAVVTSTITPSLTRSAGTLSAKLFETPSITIDPDTILPTETPLPAPISPLPEGCIDASLVTLQSVGQTLCVGGTVFNATKTHGVMYIAFNSNQSAFYLVGYDWNSAQGYNQGDCIYTNGLIQSVGSVPMMKVDRASVHACTPPTYDTPTPPATLPSGCRFALDFRLLDYGKLMCAGGVVAYVNAHEDIREVYFSLVLSQGVHFVVRGVAEGDRGFRPGECIYSANRRIDKTGLVLVMLLTSADIQRCR